MWQPIADLNPTLWKRYVVMWRNGEWGVAMWKYNSRWGEHEYAFGRKMTDDEREFSRTHPQPYFGAPDEGDDYDDALPENAPTHFIEVEPLPAEAGP